MPSAMITFDNTMQRAFKQIDLYKRLSRIRLSKSPHKIPAVELSEIVRTSLVLGVSALDSYFTNKFVEKLVPFLKKRGPTDGIVEILEKAGFTVRTALEIIPRTSGERPYRKIRTLMDRHLEKYTTQRFDVIDKLFLTMGLKGLTGHAQKKSRRKKLLRRVEILVKRRHRIVHDGDLNDHGRLCEISHRDIEGRLKDVALLVGNCDQIIDSHI